MQHPKHQVLIKFLLLCFILSSYFGYLTYEYDLLTGGIAALITWSFFVLCTPIADAGFLLDFPLRLLFGIRMIFSEIVVWAIADQHLVGANARGVSALCEKVRRRGSCDAVDGVGYARRPSGPRLAHV